jgi:hypothetical protein
MPTLDACLGSKFLGTNLDSFEANGILELLDHALDLSLVLQIMSSPFELFFLFFGSEPIDFHSKMVPCRFSLNFATFWSFTLNLKATGPIYGFHPIGLLYFIGPLSLMYSGSKVGATLDEHTRFKVQRNGAILLDESHKLDPWPLDEGGRPKSGKSRLNLHGTILERKSIG